MRITGGQARGIPISAGNSKSIRPATDRTRESVFSSLGSIVENSRCLDLFAGTGSYGLEALSRGAASCTFLEKEGRSIATLKINLQAVAKSLNRSLSDSRVQKGDVTKINFQQNEAYNIIFIDPPYPQWESLMGALTSKLHPALLDSPQSRVVCEAPGGKALDLPNLSLIKKLGGKKAHDPAVLIFAIS